MNTKVFHKSFFSYRHFAGRTFGKDHQYFEIKANLSAVHYMKEVP